MENLPQYYSLVLGENHRIEITWILNLKELAKANTSRMIQKNCFENKQKEMHMISLCMFI